MGTRPPKSFSFNTSGSQNGGFAKRFRNASGCNDSNATAGRCESTLSTGTCRGSKFGNFDKGVNTDLDTVK